MTSDNAQPPQWQSGQNPWSSQWQHQPSPQWHGSSTPPQQGWGQPTGVGPQVPAQPSGGWTPAAQPQQPTGAWTPAPQPQQTGAWPQASHQPPQYGGWQQPQQPGFGGPPPGGWRQPSQPQWGQQAPGALPPLGAASAAGKDLSRPWAFLGAAFALAMIAGSLGTWVTFYTNDGVVARSGLAGDGRITVALAAAALVFLLVHALVPGARAKGVYLLVADGLSAVSAVIVAVALTGFDELRASGAKASLGWGIWTVLAAALSASVVCLAGFILHHRSRL